MTCLQLSESSIESPTAGNEFDLCFHAAYCTSGGRKCITLVTICCGCASLLTQEPYAVRAAPYSAATNSYLGQIACTAHGQCHMHCNALKFDAQVSQSLCVAQTALWCFLGQAMGAHKQRSGLTTTQNRKPNLYSELLTRCPPQQQLLHFPAAYCRAAHGHLHKSSMPKPSVLPSLHIRIMEMQCNGENLPFLTD